MAPFRPLHGGIYEGSSLLMSDMAKFFSKFISLFSREKPASGGSSLRRGDYTEYFNALGLGSGSAMNIAVVSACVNLLSQSVAALPLEPKRKRGEVFVDDSTNGLWHLLNVAPNRWENAFDFKRRIVIELLLEGNAYIVPAWSMTDGSVESLVLCERGSVARDDTSDTYTYNGKEYDSEEIIHIKRFPDPLNPKRGVSVIHHASMSLDIARAGDTETLNRFVYGGAVRGIISNDSGVRGFGAYADEQLEKTAESLDERFQRGERIVSTPRDTKFNPMSLSSTDLQFLETRKFTVTEICRFFSVNPAFVFADAASNYKAAEQASLDYLDKTLNPILVNIETELLRVLVSPRLSRKRKIEFDRSRFFTCDLLTRVKWQGARLGAGLATANELRLEDNMPPLPGGDTLLMSANLKTIDQLIEENSKDDTEEIPEGDSDPGSENP